MARKYFLDIVINKEELSDAREVFVAHCTTLGVASQGMTYEEAIKNIKEAISLYLEEMPHKIEELGLTQQPPLFSIVEVEKGAKTTCIVR